MLGNCGELVKRSIYAESARLAEAIGTLKTICLVWRLASDRRASRRSRLGLLLALAVQGPRDERPTVADAGSLMAALVCVPTRHVRAGLARSLLLSGRGCDPERLDCDRPLSAAVAAWGEGG